MTPPGSAPPRSRARRAHASPAGFRGPASRPRIALARAAQAASTLATVALGALLACGAPRAVDTRPPYERWATAFTDAQRAAAAGDYVRADTTLVAYVRDNPGTAEATDAVFWRGVLALDPANPRASAALAAAAFDEYLRSGALLRRHEAEVMRRLALRLGPASVAAAGAADTTGGGEAARPADARDEEIRRLREELRKTTEELERIKRRIAAPPGTPPPPRR